MKLILNLQICVISKYLNISRSTLYRWIEEGAIKPINKSRLPNRSRLDQDTIKQDLLNYILKNNTKTLKEITNYISIKYKINISITTIHMFCIKNKISYKKGSKYYSEASEEKKQLFISKIELLDKSNIIALDEVCVKIA